MDFIFFFFLFDSLPVLRAKVASFLSIASLEPLPFVNPNSDLEVVVTMFEPSPVFFFYRYQTGI